MADFLLELLSEEIPARMQAKARNDLARRFAECTGEAGLTTGVIDVHSLLLGALSLGLVPVLLRTPSDVSPLVSWLRLVQTFSLAWIVPYITRDRREHHQLRRAHEHDPVGEEPGGVDRGGDVVTLEVAERALAFGCTVAPRVV